MNKKELVPVFAAVAVALLGAAMMKKYVREQETSWRQANEKEQTWVLVAEESVLKGDSIRSDKLGYKSVAKADQPWSSIMFSEPESSTEAMRKYEDLKASFAGHVVGRDIPKGDIILWTDFEKPKSLSLSNILKPNTRAVALIVDRDSVLSGLLQPGDRVDVLATYGVSIDVQGSTTTRGRVSQVEKTVVVLEDINVLAVGNRTGRSNSAGKMYGGTRVVLGLTPDRALQLTHVQKRARISLLMRPRGTESAGDYKARVVTNRDIEDLASKLRDKRGDIEIKGGQ